VSHRTRNTGPAETTPSVEFLSEFYGVVPTPAVPGVIADPRLRIGDPEGNFKRRSMRPSSTWMSAARGRAVVKPCLAPSTASGNALTTLAEKNRLFHSRKIKNLWKLFYDFRADFTRPDESDSLRSLCVAWERKHKSRSPRALSRFFKKYPDLAVWATWVESAIQETPIRSAKNQFPRMDLLRRCLEVLGRPQVQRLTGGKRFLDEPKNAS
jgi:hypothetical protein